MFPTRLNLIPPDKKRRIHKIIIFQSIKNFFELLLIIACLGGIVLLGSEMILQERYNDLTLNIVSLNNRNMSANRQINAINRRIKEINNIQSMYIVWTPILTQLAAGVPSGVVLSTMDINAKTKKLSLTGHADTRDDLLLFQRNLQTNNCPNILCVDTLPIPPSLLTQQQDINFHLKATMTKK